MTSFGRADTPLPLFNLNISEITIRRSEQLKNVLSSQTDLEAAAKRLGVTDTPTRNGDFLFYEIKGNKDIQDNADAANNQLYYCYIPKENHFSFQIH